MKRTTTPTGEPIGPRVVRALAALGLALSLGGCDAQSHQNTSGETHFLTMCTQDCTGGLECIAGACTQACTRTADCAELSSAAECVAVAAGSDRACDVSCEADRECATLGDAFGCSEGRCRVRASSADAGTQPDAATPETDAGLLACAPGCSPVYGYPEDVGRGCVDSDRPTPLGCDCTPQSALPTCGRRGDGTLWVYWAGELESSAGMQACSPAEQERVHHGCDFDACERPPGSTCSLEATCGERGCTASPLSDANGCERVSCEGDSECGADERCVPIDCVSSGWCTTRNDGVSATCNCSGPAACFRAAYCNPTAEVGPAGPWQRIEIEAFSGECATDCTTTWSVGPDGALTRTVDSGQTTAMLTELELQSLATMIDGPELRVALRDGRDCGPEIQDLVVTFRLVLPDVTLEQNMTSCILDAETGGNVALAYELITKY